MLTMPSGLQDVAISEKFAKEIDQALRKFRTDIVAYLEQLAKDQLTVKGQGQEEHPKVRYWKQQISGTLVAYPDMELQGLHNEKGISETATSMIIFLMDANVSKSIEEDEILRERSAQQELVKDAAELQNLYHALHDPGKLIPDNATEKVIIESYDVTKIAITLAKITLLLYLVEHYVKIEQSKISNNILPLFTHSWLQNQVEIIRKIAEKCSDHVEYAPVIIQRDPVNFDEALEIALLTIENLQLPARPAYFAPVLERYRPSEWERYQLYVSNRKARLINFNSADTPWYQFMQTRLIDLKRRWHFFRSLNEPMIIVVKGEFPLRTKLFYQFLYWLNLPLAYTLMRKTFFAQCKNIIEEIKDIFSDRGMQRNLVEVSLRLLSLFFIPFILPVLMLQGFVLLPNMLFRSLCQMYCQNENPTIGSKLGGYVLSIFDLALIAGLSRHFFKSSYLNHPIVSTVITHAIAYSTIFLIGTTSVLAAGFLIVNLGRLLIALAVNSWRLLSHLSTNFWQPRSSDRIRLLPRLSDHRMPAGALHAAHFVASHSSPLLHAFPYVQQAERLATEEELGQPVAHNRLSRHMNPANS